jgi:hypothetical protein
MAISLKQDGGFRPKLFTASPWKACQKTDEMKFHWGRCSYTRSAEYLDNSSLPPQG